MNPKTTPLSQEIDFQKRVLWLNGALPALLLILDLFSGRLGANPPEAIIRTTGVVALVFLTLALMVTPLVRYSRWFWIVRHRRWLGLWCFYYALMHWLSYSIFDKAGDLKEILADIQKRPFILLGFLAFILLIPLAVTSTNEMIKRLGPTRWKKLHQLTYLIAPLAATHYILIVKSDLRYPVAFAVVLGVLLLWRWPIKLRS
jgi:sulfoxide reductase heme-binding subunit YedZ